jgi:hypothetical protein
MSNSAGTPFSLAAYKDSIANRLLRESKEIKSNFGNR